MAIEPKDLLTVLVGSYPKLRHSFVVNAEEWISQEGGIEACALFRLTADCILEGFTDGNFDGAEELFGTVERCLTLGSREVADAAATCFLEKVINSPEMGQLAVHFMGKLSKQHCRAWDSFTGVVTPGL